MAHDAVVAVGVAAGDLPELAVRQVAVSAVWASCAVTCSGVASRARGPNCRRGLGVAGQYRLPLEMMAPWWVPWGPRSPGCRSVMIWAPAARSGMAQCAAMRWA